MNGLSSQEAKKRLVLNGRNIVARKSRVIWFEVLLRQFLSPLVYVLLIATVVTLFLRDYSDAVLIIVAVVINTLLGFYQEYRAEKSIEALEKLLDPIAKVKRDGQWVEIDAKDIVVGDLVRLEIGQRVPADCLIVLEDGMFVNESILTGESASVEKTVYRGEVKDGDGVWFDKVVSKHKVYMGTTVLTGIGEALVIRVGSKARFGMIARDVTMDLDEKTPLQEKIASLSRFLSIFVGIVAVFVLVFGLLLGDSLVEIFPTSVALAVSAIPEGLIISLTLILTVGMQRILKKKAVVRKLVAAETLGSVSVICLDKTGTITEGEMRPIGPVSFLNIDIEKQITGMKKLKHDYWERILLACMLCNDHRDPLEIGMDSWIKSQITDKLFKTIHDRYQRVDGIPFDPKSKYLVTLHRDSKSGREFLFLSGAPEVCLKHVKMPLREVSAWHEKFGDLGRLGYRMVGFCFVELPHGKREKIKKEEIKNMKWLGVMCFEDPVRKGVSSELKKAMMAGIDIKIITGDYKETAWAVLQKLKLVSGEVDSRKVLLGDEITQLVEAKAYKELSERVRDALLFARTTPEQKKYIVSSLQNDGEVVAMTGDGVNDAPAIKKADIGIVVNKASDVAKETADIVLLNNDFGTILAAVEEGRAVFDNFQKVLVYLLSDAFAAVVVTILGLVTKSPLPLTASSILWINLISDGFPYMALTVEPKDKDLLSRKPLRRDAQLLSLPLIMLMIFVSLLVGGLTFGIFYWDLYVTGNTLSHARTIAFATLGLMTLLYVFLIRTLLKPAWSVGLFSNIWLVLGVVLGGLVMSLVFFIPDLREMFDITSLGGRDVIRIAVSVFMAMVAIECFKPIVRRWSSDS